MLTVSIDLAAMIAVLASTVSLAAKFSLDRLNSPTVKPSPDGNR
jgi:hypothetical protein